MQTKGTNKYSLRFVHCIKEAFLVLQWIKHKWYRGKQPWWSPLSVWLTHCIFLGPAPRGSLILVPIRLVHMCNLWNQRIIGVWVCQQRTDWKQYLKVANMNNHINIHGIIGLVQLVRWCLVLECHSKADQCELQRGLFSMQANLIALSGHFPENIVKAGWWKLNQGNWISNHH